MPYAAPVPGHMATRMDRPSHRVLSSSLSDGFFFSELQTAEARFVLNSERSSAHCWSDLLQTQCLTAGLGLASSNSNDAIRTQDSSSVCSETWRRKGL